MILRQRLWLDGLISTLDTAIERDPARLLARAAFLKERAMESARPARDWIEDYRHPAHRCPPPSNMCAAEHVRTR